MGNYKVTTAAFLVGFCAGLVLSVYLLSQQNMYVLKTFCSPVLSDSSEQNFVVTWRNATNPWPVDNDRIFLIETSGRGALNVRQSCSVESAARENPTRPVHLILTGDTVNKTSSTYQVLATYPNVNIFLVDIADVYNGTPLQDWFEEGRWRKSPYAAVHLSDYTRILLVHLGGGQYLDLDFIVQKSLDDDKQLRNFATYEDKGLFTNSAFHFDHGHPIPGKMIQHLAANYNPDSWSGHGPLMFDHIINSNCQITNGTPVDCQPLHLVEPRVFFPFYYPRWRLMFDKDVSQENVELIRNATGVHLWNKLSVNETVVKGSTQLYSVLAAEHCPLTYSIISDIF